MRVRGRAEARATARPGPADLPGGGCRTVAREMPRVRTIALALVAWLSAPADARAHDPAREKDPPRYATVVRASRLPIAASERSVDAREISVSPRRRSADDLLRLVPGLLLSQHGAEGKGPQLYMRGFDAGHGADVEVSVAGIPVNELSNIHGQGYIDLNFVIPEVVRGIHVAKGPFQVQQGNFANAGSIRFDLGVDRPARGARFGYELGSTSRHRGVFVLAPRALARETFLAVEAMRDRGFAPGRQAQRIVSLGQVRLVDRREYGSLDLLGGAAYAQFGAPGALRQDDFAAGAVPFDGSYQPGGGSSLRALVGLRHQIAIGRGKLDHRVYGQLRDLEIAENFTGYLLDAVHGDRRLQRHRFFSGGYRLEYTRPLGERVVLFAGGTWQGDAIAQSESQLDAQHGVVARRWDLDVVQHAVAAMAGVRVRATRWLYLEGGVRGDIFHYQVRDHLREEFTTRRNLARVSPRLLLAIRPSPAWSLFAAYGRGLRAPEARSILAAAPMADAALDRYRGGAARIVPADSVEVGARLQPRPWVSAGVALFGTWIDRELVFDHVSAVNLELNRTRRLGVEVDLALRPRPWLELREDFTLTHARFVGSGAPVPGAPPLLSATSLTLVHPRGPRLGARLVVVGARPLPHGARASSYALLDVSVGHRVGPLQFDLGIDNVTGAAWKEGEYHYASWWNTDDPRSTLPALHFIAGPPLVVRAAVTFWL